MNLYTILRSFLHSLIIWYLCDALSGNQCGIKSLNLKEVRKFADADLFPPCLFGVIFFIMAHCWRCKNEDLILKDYEFFSYYECHECGWTDFTNNLCCKSPDVVQVMVEQGNGKWVRRNGCKICKSLIGKVLPKGFDYQDLPTLKRDKYLEYQQQYSEIRDYCRKQMFAFGEKYRQLKKAEHTVQYYQYLESDIWKKKVQMVKKRDAYICQACLINPAQAVHHITYEHIYNEPLFDLVSICHKCHSSIHNK